MNGNYRQKQVITCLGLLLGMSCSVAWAHIDIEPKQTIPSRWETFLLNVPTEMPTTTVSPLGKSTVASAHADVS